jgi:hypothetical protein
MAVVYAFAGKEVKEREDVRKVDDFGSTVRRHRNTASKNQSLNKLVHETSCP